jgi:hypothetical protein
MEVEISTSYLTSLVRSDIEESLTSIVQFLRLGSSFHLGSAYSRPK